MYITKQEMIDQFGVDELIRLTDRADPPANDIDDDVLNSAISDAADEMNVHIGKAHTLPIPTNGVTRRLNGVIAVYFLANTADLMTERRRQDYEDALSLLKLIAKGEASLGIENPPEPKNGIVAVSGPVRIFNRDNMKGVL